MYQFENAKDHVDKLAGDYKCWGEKLTHEEAIELSDSLKKLESLEKKFSMINDAHSLWERGVDSDTVMELIDSAVKDLEDFYNRRYSEVEEMLEDLENMR